MNLDIEELKQQLTQAKVDAKDLRNQCDMLRQSFKDKYPPKTCPLYLARQSSLSHTPLLWRYSSVGSKLGDKCSCEDFYRVIAPMSESEQVDMLNIEQERIRLGYFLSIATYKIARLEILIHDLGQWLVNTKKSSAHQHLMYR